jgi:hypothetical protein
MKATAMPTIRASDKGAVRQIGRAFCKYNSEEIERMDTEEITRITMEAVKRISEGRSARNNPNGWSALARVVNMRISVHGTYIKVKDRLDREKIMKERVEELMRREKKMVLSDDEIGWMNDNGLNNRPVTWKEWKEIYWRPSYNYDQYMRLQGLNSGRRRREWRMMSRNRMCRIQSEADAGRIGGVIREIINKRKGFKMEVIIDKDKCINDPKEVTEVGTSHFQQWFERSDAERERDGRLQRLIANNDGKG